MNKENDKKEHYTTPHSWTGGVAFIMFVSNLSVALVSSRNGFFKSTVHRYLGGLAMMSGFAAVGTGVAITKFGVWAYGEWRWALLAGIVAVFLATVATKPSLKKRSM